MFLGAQGWVFRQDLCGGWAGTGVGRGAAWPRLENQSLWFQGSQAPCRFAGVGCQGTGPAHEPCLYTPPRIRGGVSLFQELDYPQIERHTVNREAYRHSEAPRHPGTRALPRRWTFPARLRAAQFPSNTGALFPKGIVMLGCWDRGCVPAPELGLL